MSDVTGLDNEEAVVRQRESRQVSDLQVYLRTGRQSWRAARGESFQQRQTTPSADDECAAAAVRTRRPTRAGGRSRPSASAPSTPAPPLASRAHAVARSRTARGTRAPGLEARVGAGISRARVGGASARLAFRFAPGSGVIVGPGSDGGLGRAAEQRAPRPPRGRQGEEEEGEREEEEGRCGAAQGEQPPRVHLQVLHQGAQGPHDGRGEAAEETPRADPGPRGRGAAPLRRPGPGPARVREDHGDQVPGQALHAAQPERGEGPHHGGEREEAPDPVRGGSQRPQRHGRRR